MLRESGNIKLLDVVHDDIVFLRLCQSTPDDAVSDTGLLWALVCSFYRSWNWLPAEAKSLDANSRLRMEESPLHTDPEDCTFSSALRIGQFIC